MANLKEVYKFLLESVGQNIEKANSDIIKRNATISYVPYTSLVKQLWKLYNLPSALEFTSCYEIKQYPDKLTKETPFKFKLIEGIQLTLNIFSNSEDQAFYELWLGCDDGYYGSIFKLSIDGSEQEYINQLSIYTCGGFFIENFKKTLEYFQHIYKSLEKDGTKLKLCTGSKKTNKAFVEELINRTDWLKLVKYDENGWG